MSILNVNTIQPVGSGQTITVSAANISAPSTVVTASSFVGNVTATTISGVSTAGITTAYIGAINDGPLSGARNIIINGSMVVNQRGWTGAAGTTTSNAYVTDRFGIEHIHDGAVSAGQTSMTSGNAFDDGFRNALFFNVTTADASLAAGQYQVIYQAIEGFNVQGIRKGTPNALPVTLSFWCRSTTTGTYIAELVDGDNIRQVSQAYTINAANTWEKKTLTFPSDTTGAFDNDNAQSLTVFWWLAAGSTYSGGGALQTTWGNTSANRVVGQTNLLATAGNNFWLTGVQLEVGSVATPFERRSYGQELALCQRYYEQFEYTATYQEVHNPTRIGETNSQQFTKYFTQKRDVPNITTSAVGTFRVNDSVNDQVCNGIMISSITNRQAAFSFTKATANMTRNGAGYINAELNNDAYIYISAEL